MNTISMQSLIKDFDWRWVVVSYCFFVLFHLLTTFLLISPVIASAILGIWGSAIWAGLGVGSISCYVGYRSNRYTLFEPGLASMFYSVTLSLIVGRALFKDPLVNLIKYEIPFAIIVLCCSLFGAALGEWIQWRREMKAAKAAEGSAAQ
ncbi:MAG: hypothetical protein V1799_15515 [bacterium]